MTNLHNTSFVTKYLRAQVSLPLDNRRCNLIGPADAYVWINEGKKAFRIDCFDSVVSLPADDWTA